ncbi:MAG: ABC transporter ATP-binding protein [Deltaproteobacteria bacterium]|nr:ABC transporter ATP-binding protein [Deltaproteobacteria bacterium]
MSEQAVIEIKALNKTYPLGFVHRYEALKNVELSVKKSEIFGFLGPNGAGKTTLIKSILGLLKYDSGSIKLFDKDIDNTDVKNNIGYLPETPNFYSYLSAFEIMKLYARLYNMKDSSLTPHPPLSGGHEGFPPDKGASLSPPPDKGDRGGYGIGTVDNIIKGKLELVGLKDAIHTRLRAFSKGMLQRLGMAQALINDPMLLIFDEPMSGLDPLGRAEFKEIMRSLRKQGKTIFFSSHIIPDAEELCDRVAVIRKGQIIKTGTVTELMDTEIVSVDIAAKGKITDQLKQGLKDILYSPATSDNQYIFHIKEMGRTNEVLSELMKNGFSIIKVEPVRLTLETLISNMIKEN